MKYQVDELKTYIGNSKTVVIREDLKIKLAEDLFIKYKNGIYDEGIKFILNSIDQINNLGIVYPANAKPIYYVYIVPRENFRKLLNYPTYRDKNGGGKPVTSYDLDGFKDAYGVSDNLLESSNEINLMKTINNIHEFAHLIVSMFFNKDRFIAEGFAEALPLYTMDYEKVFDEHRNMIINLDSSKILSAQELIISAKENDFNEGTIAVNKSCSFDYTYISSYLFIRGCLEQISQKFNLNKILSTQKFLEIIRESNCINEWLVYDIAYAIGLNPNQLLNSIVIQLEVIKKMSNYGK